MTSKDGGADCADGARPCRVGVEPLVCPAQQGGSNGKVETSHQEVQSYRSPDRVVLIDGCFLSCHARMLRDIVGADRLVEFDALSFYKKYTDVFGIDDVPEEERKAAARLVADAVLEAMRAS